MVRSDEDDDNDLALERRDADVEDACRGAARVAAVEKVEVEDEEEMRVLDLALVPLAHMPTF